MLRNSVGKVREIDTEIDETNQHMTTCGHAHKESRGGQLYFPSP